MEEEREGFLPYRKRIVYSLAVASVLVLLPFTINNFLQGREGLGAATAAVIAVLLLDALAIFRRRPLPIPLWFLALPVIVGFIVAMDDRLYISLAWAYPAVLLFYFLLPPRPAIVVASLIVVVVSALAFVELDASYATRISATLALTLILASSFMGIVDDLHRRLREQAITDALTGAFNRRHMDALLEDAVERRRRGEAAPSIVALDIDHFKSVNDRFGHAAGDVVLREIVARIQREVRRIDRFFRSGGEEFVLLLPATSRAGAAKAAEGIRRSIEAKPFLSGETITVSAGVAELAPGQAVAQWLAESDAALYEAKRLGRNRVIVRGAPGGFEPGPG